MASPTTYSKQLNAVPFDLVVKLSLLGIALFLAYDGGHSFTAQSHLSIITSLMFLGCTNLGIYVRIYVTWRIYVLT